ncbi:hypothetical protein [Oceanobacter mangrovi]|uniref:hypothetical protein n=1 Tax=Oceanobacter mangrovi TaxID=2862510 RepID=UPI001C8D4057|nr:hypothetical protein [Oceanobacter mangrovi]
MNEITKRRAVYTVLSEVIDGDQLWEVMWRWQRGYAAKSQYELHGFFNDCRHIAEISANRSKLYKDLIGLLMGSGDGLREDPYGLMEEFSDRASSVEDVGADDLLAWQQALVCVLASLLRQIPPEQLQTWRGRVEERAQQQGVAADLVYAFSRIMLGKPHNVDMVFSPLQLKHLLNQVYVVMCEMFGPVQADKQLAQAVERANRMQPGGLDARKLLQQK